MDFSVSSTSTERARHRRKVIKFCSQKCVSRHDIYIEDFFILHFFVSGNKLQSIFTRLLMEDTNNLLTSNCTFFTSLNDSSANTHDSQMQSEKDIKPDQAAKEL